MSDLFTCWHCGKPLEAVILPMSRREECSTCHSDQHVCKMCLFFKDTSRGECLEEQAEWISNREKSNFCDYFKPSKDKHQFDTNNANQHALAEFANLFGNTPEPSVQDKDKGKGKSAGEIAEQQLRDLLGS